MWVLSVAQMSPSGTQGAGTAPGHHQCSYPRDGQTRGQSPFRRPIENRRRWGNADDFPGVVSLSRRAFSAVNPPRGRRDRDAKRRRVRAPPRWAGWQATRSACRRRCGSAPGSCRQRQTLDQGHHRGARKVCRTPVGEVMYFVPTPQLDRKPPPPLRIDVGDIRSACFGPVHPQPRGGLNPRGGQRLEYVPRVIISHKLGSYGSARPTPTGDRSTCPRVRQCRRPRPLCRRRRCPRLQEDTPSAARPCWRRNPLGHASAVPRSARHCGPGSGSPDVPDQNL